MAVFLPRRGWWITLATDPTVFAQPFAGNLLERRWSLTDEPFELFVSVDYDPALLARDPRIRSIRALWCFTEEELQNLGLHWPEEFVGQLLDNAQARALLYTNYEDSLTDLARVYEPVRDLLRLRQSGSEAGRSLARQAFTGDQGALALLAEVLRDEGHPLAQALRRLSDPRIPAEWGGWPRGSGAEPLADSPVPAVAPSPAPLSVPVAVPTPVEPVELQAERTFSHPRTVPALAFTSSPQGNLLLASACCDGSVRLWDLERGEMVREWLLEGLASAVAFSPDGTLLAGGNNEGDLFVWELATGRERFFRHSWQGAFYGLAFSPDGQVIASANEKGSLSLWDPQTGGDRGQLLGHRGRVWSLSFAVRDGQTLLASGAEDGTVRLWDPSTRQELLSLPGGRDQVTSVAFTPEGGRLAAAVLEQGVRIWSFSDNQPVEHPPLEPAHPAHAVAWAAGGKRLALVDAGGLIHVWSLDQGSVGRCEGHFQAHTRAAHALLFVPGSVQRLASAGEDGAVHLWNLESLGSA